MEINHKHVCLWRNVIELCNENQLEALFTLNFFVKIPLHFSDVFIAHHQEVLIVYVQ
jgi:hypothetical protein